MSKKSTPIFIGPDGKIVSIYNDNVDLSSVGKVKIRRASHVEPDKNGKWVADLSPVGGPKLGPFKRREDALRAEVVWLEKNLVEAVKKRK